MSVIIGRVYKHGMKSGINLRELESLTLYDKQARTRAFFNGCAEVALFDYGSPQEFEVVDQSDESTVLAQGVLSSHSRDWIPPLLNEKANQASPLDHPESVCAVGIYEDELRVFSSCPGTDGFLYLDSEDCWVFTNHLPLLYPFLEDSASLSPISLAWTLQKHHNFGYEHHLAGIKRTRPGSKWIVSKDGSHEVAMRSSWDELTTRIDDRELPMLVEDYASSLSDYILGTQCGKSLSLSGGKDSRAILGMLGDSIYGKWISFSTAGEPYSPDVMAAIDLMELAELRDKHYVSSPPLIAQPREFSSSIARDIQTDLTLSSLADIRWVGARTSIVLGGHEYGSKGSDTGLTLSKLIDREMGQLASSPLLSREGSELLSKNYRTSLEAELGGVPSEKIEVAWKLRFRLPLLTGGTLTANNAGAAEVHPFLDYRALRLILGSAPEFTSAQAFHYLLNRRMTRPIENAPFADDRWPKALEEFVVKMGLQWRGKPATPYRFNSAFPSQSSFGRYNWRIELFKGARTKMLEYLHDGDYEDSLVNVSAMAALISKDESEWSFFNLYQLGAILRFCLVNAAGVESINSSRSDKIEGLVNEFISSSESKQVTSSQGKLERALKENLERAQQSIADLARQIHNSEARTAAGLDPEGCVKLLEEGVLRTEELQTLVPVLSSFGQFQRLPDDAKRVEYKTLDDGHGKVEIEGYLFKSDSTTVLIGFAGSEDDEVEGLTWSPKGFHYRYIKPDSTGYFRLAVKLPHLQGKEISFFVQRWYSPGPVYLSIM
ncbi:hypothetical protein [Corynebacterium sp. HMSC068G04]|uniref:hypothetical protein n=1 Tax=Corynebacterium sp. HMSC068G04 TaxID=1739497 RepID=UPI00114C965E|nr:hypothetical protein [Corynebacterium sp. HMSC068G04]